jgi:hypothetical protein
MNCLRRPSEDEKRTVTRHAQCAEMDKPSRFDPTSSLMGVAV